jgi:hypothetical protein
MLSQNGRVVLDNYGGPLIMSTVPGTTVRYLGGVLNGDINTIFMYWGHRWNTEVEPLRQDKGCWGYMLRSIRGSNTSTSNHASGSATDTNAVLHPLGTQTLTSHQKAVIAAMVTALRGVVRSGAFYSGRKDEMHCEVVGSNSQVAAVAADIRAGKLPNTPAALITNPSPAPKPNKPTPPSPTQKKEWYEMALTQEIKDEIGQVVFDKIRDFFGVSGVALSPHALEDVRAVTASSAQAGCLDVIRHEGVNPTQAMVDAISDAVVAKLGK